MTKPAALGPLRPVVEPLGRVPRVALLGGFGALIGVVFTVAGPLAAGLILVGLVALVVTVWFPGVLYAAYLLIPFYKAAVQPYSPVDFTVILALLCVAQVLFLFSPRERHSISRGGLILWLLLLMTVIGGVLYAQDQAHALSQAIEFVALVAVPIFAAAIRVGSDERHMRQFVGTFFAMGLVTVLFGLAGLSESGRLEVLDTNTIQTSRSALLVPLLAILFVPRISSPWIRLLAMLVGVAAVVVALASGSRGPIVALLLLGALGAVRYLSQPRRSDGRLIGVTIVLAAASIAIVLSGAIDLPETATARFEGLAGFIGEVASGTDAPSVDTSSEARVNLYGAAFETFANNPVLGVGTAGYQAAASPIMWPVTPDPYPHNALLQLGAEHGLVGATVFVALIVLAFLRPISTSSVGHAIRVLLLFFLINAMFSVNVYEDRMLWGLLALLTLVKFPVPESDAPPAGASYLTPNLAPQPFWVRNLRAAGWDWTPQPYVPPVEPGPYALAPPGSNSPADQSVPKRSR